MLEEPRKNDTTSYSWPRDICIDRSLARAAALPRLRRRKLTRADRNDGKGNPMTIIVILGSVIGAALIVCAVAYTRRSRKDKEPIQLDVGRKVRQ
jgi:hypothetical protein